MWVTFHQLAGVQALNESWIKDQKLLLKHFAKSRIREFWRFKLKFFQKIPEKFRLKKLIILTWRNDQKALWREDESSSVNFV
jgi:hypothetical protein